MALENPWGLLLLLLIPILWWLRRIFRPPVVLVPSFYLWETVLDDEKEGASGARRPPLPLIETTVLVLLALAAARPVGFVPARGEREVTVILETGPTMAAVFEETETRFDRLRTILLSHLSHLERDDRVTLRFVPGTGTRDLSPKQAMARLQEAEPKGWSAPLAPHVSDGRIWQRRGTNRSLIVAATRPPENWPADAPANRTLLLVGGTRPNAGIVRLGVEGKAGVAVCLATSDQDRTLEIRTDGGAPVRRKVRLRKGIHQTVLFPVPPSATSVAVSFASTDDFPWDDRASLHQIATTPPRVETGSDLPTAVLRALAAAGAELVAGEGETDIWVGRASPPDGVPAVLLVEPASLKPVSTPDLVLEPNGLTSAALADITVRRALSLPKEAGRPVLRTTEGQTFIAWDPDKSRVSIGLGFSNEAGDWIHHPAFPIFWAQLLESLRPGTTERRPLKPGDRLEGRRLLRPGAVALGDGRTVHVSLLSEEATKLGGKRALPDIPNPAPGKTKAAPIPLTPYLAILAILVLLGGWLGRWASGNRKFS